MEDEGGCLLTLCLSFVLTDSLRRWFRVFVFGLVAGSLGVVPHLGACEANVVKIATFASTAASVACDIFLAHVTVFAQMALVALREIQG